MLDRIHSLIGLATRAGKTVSGETAVLSAIRSGKAELVLISAEASERTKKKFQDKCTYYNIPYRFSGDLESLGKAVGKPFRAVAAVMDRGFAEKLIENLSVEDAS